MGGCMANRLKSGTSRFFPSRRSQNWPLAGPPNSLGRGRMKKTASTEAAGCRIDGAQDVKKEILAKNSRRLIRALGNALHRAKQALSTSFSTVSFRYGPGMSVSD